MNSQRPALDLDRYRRLKEKARLSHSPRVVSSSSPSVSENQKNDSNKTEPTNKYSPKNISYTTASFSPDPKNTGSRFACGVLSNNNNNHQTPPTSASSLANSESRRRRLDKYTSRTTRQSEPTPCSPKPSIEIQLNEYYYEPRNNHYNYKLGLNYFEKGSVSSYYEEEEGPNDRYDATSGYDKYESTTTTASARTSNIPTAVMAKCRSSGEKERTTTNIPGSPSKLGGGDRRILEKERTTTTRIPGSPSNRGGNRRILMDASPRRSSSSSSTEKQQQQQQQQHSSRILQLEDPTTAMRRPPVDPPEYRETELPGTSRRDTSTVKRTIASKKNGTMPTTTLFGSSSSYSSGITPPPAANYFHSASVVEDSSSLEVIPTDEELFRVGWGKALDAKSKCYYYFTHDRTQIVWDNPLAAAGRVRSKKDKDRIEALRAIKSDEESREPLVEIDGDSSTLSRLDRVESIRGSSPTNDSLDMRQSLGMPSLSSRYSNENNNKRDSRRRPPGYGRSTGKMMSLGNHDPYRDDPPTTTSQPRGISLSSTSNPSTPKEERDSQKMAKERMHWTEKFRSFRYSSDITPRRSQEGKLLRQMSSPQHSSTATPPKTEANAAPFTFHKNHRKEREASAPFTFHKNRKISSHKAPENNMIQNTERESAASLEEDLPSLSVSIPEPSIKIYRFQSTSPTRPNLDQKTVRLLYSKDFTELIHRHRSTRRRTVGNYLSDQGAKPQFPRPQGVSFVVRKRPISEVEQENGDFDVVDCETGRSNELNVYHTKILPDLKTKDFKTMSFRCDSVFSELRSTEEFYIRVGQPLVLAAKNGGNSTFVMYGSSGSGKSHTMTDIEERAVYDIFGESSGEPSQQVFAQYVELSGNQCYDLLGPVGRFVRVVDKGGYFGFRGALSRPASNARDLLSILSDAKRRAATQNTIRKHSESQSYLLCQIKIGQERSQGCLTLLECASYEHVRHVESSGDTNEATSFDALFDSIQSKASCKAATKSLHIKHNVTKILNESLKSETSGVCVVATLAPNATATESTLSTLSSLQKLMTGSTENDQSTICSPSNDETSTEDLILPRQWSHSELVNWMARKRLLASPVPPDINGRFAMRMSKMQLKNTFYDVLDDKKAEKLFLALRAENDRIARIRVKRRMALQKEGAQF